VRREVIEALGQPPSGRSGFLRFVETGEIKGFRFGVPALAIQAVGFEHPFLPVGLAGKREAGAKEQQSFFHSSRVS
jgi:hypothetical protein